LIFAGARICIDCISVVMSSGVETSLTVPLCESERILDPFN
jgi:hypothetical protein